MYTRGVPEEVNKLEGTHQEGRPKDENLGYKKFMIKKHLQGEIGM